MAHFVRIDKNSIVVDRHVVNNAVLIDKNGIEKEELGQQFLSNLWGGQPTDYIQTSYNGSFRKVFASLGYFYDKDKDEFIEPISQ